MKYYTITLKYFITYYENNLFVCKGVLMVKYTVELKYFDSKNFHEIKSYIRATV